MNTQSFLKVRIYFTALVTLFICTLLIWDYNHDGVPAHHILADKDLPAISNWWGVILLPLLTWFLLYRIQIRIGYSNSGTANDEKDLKSTLFRFGFSLLFGILLSVFFAFDYPTICGYLMLAVFPFGLFIPIYRAECLLGFVIGMTFTFGAVLPTAIGSILVCVGAFLYLLVRAGMLYVWAKFAFAFSSTSGSKH